MNTKPIMIIEDDEAIRSNLEDLLSFEGKPVVSASNGQEALEILNRGQDVCLILLDLMMPIMDGRSFLIEIKKKPRLAEIPIVVISATVNLDGLDADGVLKKPFCLDDILDVSTKFAC